jgi:hypothetical protein
MNASVHNQRPFVFVPTRLISPLPTYFPGRKNIAAQNVLFSSLIPSTHVIFPCTSHGRKQTHSHHRKGCVVKFILLIACLALVP